MNPNPTTTEPTTAREIVISRTFDAPRELLWSAWTDPKHVVNWWGPDGFTLTIQEMDVRAGGVWRHVMRSPDGTPYPNRNLFTEVVKPERLAFTHDGGRQGGPGVHFFVTWTFEALDASRTAATIHMVFPSPEGREQVVKEYNAIEGGNQTLARLAAYLPTMDLSAGRENAIGDFVISRILPAPRELVWQAWTEPRRLAQWFGPREFTTPVCSMDLRPGGEYRIVMRSPEGINYPLKGVYREIEPPERLVMTMDCSEHPDDWQDQVNPDRGADGNPAGEMLTTATLENLGDESRLTVRIRFQSAAVRDAMLMMGMREGWAENLDRLADILPKT